MDNTSSTEDQGRPTGRASPDGRASQPDTLPAQGEGQSAVPRMPHERDESASSTQTSAEPSQGRIGRAAQADAESGRVDTSKAVETDSTYDRLREDMPAAERDKKFRP